MLILGRRFFWKKKTTKNTDTPLILYVLRKNPAIRKLT